MTLPVTWETETVRPYETAEVTLPQQRRQEETGAALEAYLHSLVDPLRRSDGFAGDFPSAGRRPDGDADGGMPGGDRENGSHLYDQ